MKNTTKRKMQTIKDLVPYDKKDKGK